MNNREWRLLEALVNGEWPSKGVGPQTVDVCAQRGWVRSGRLAGNLRITKLGRLVYFDKQNRVTGRMHPELRENRLRDLRKIIGTGAVRSLQAGKSVLKVWRRTTPHNKWVENRRGEMLWHSGEGRFLHVGTYFDPVSHSPHRIFTGMPRYVVGDEGMPEESSYRLKKCYR